MFIWSATTQKWYKKMFLTTSQLLISMSQHLLISLWMTYSNHRRKHGKKLTCLEGPALLPSSKSKEHFYCWWNINWSYDLMNWKKIKTRKIKTISPWPTGYCKKKTNPRSSLFIVHVSIGTPRARRCMC